MLMRLFPWLTKVKLQDCEKEKDENKHRNKGSVRLCFSTDNEFSFELDIQRL